MRHIVEADTRRLYRIIDFKRDKVNIPGVVETIEYDPNRSAFICRLSNTGTARRRYIIHALGNLKVGQEIISSADNQVDILPGNSPCP